ncbi:MAG: FAD-binding oxidoreductase [Dehalococcoidia bacterium]|nr:FAD-binding oxidoreductase [Dehalococcoidia bacterium]
MTAGPDRPDATAGLAALRRTLPADTERAAHAYAIEDLEPRIAFAPDDRAEVAVLLRTAAEHALTVVPQASRTALALGAPLEAYDVALDLRGLHRTMEYVPDDLTVTVEAGKPLRDLQQELAEHGQYLSVDPPPDDQVSVGGLLATARGGAWRGHLPSARDLVLGIEVAQPSGALVKSGGRVVKNVTGYDLHRLHTGALGAFGVILDATFKVAPLPVATRTLAAAATSISEAASVARRAWDASLSTRAITILAPEPAGHVGLPSAPTVLVELAGSEAAVDRSTRDLAAFASWSDGPAQGWAYLRRLHGDQAGTVLRIGAPPSSIATMLEAARAAGALAWGHLAAGCVIAYADGMEAHAITALRQAAERARGYLQVEAAPVPIRRQVAPGGPGDPALVAALRDQFDPSRILNRGRWPEEGRP